LNKAFKIGDRTGSWQLLERQIELLEKRYKIEKQRESNKIVEEKLNEEREAAERKGEKQKRNERILANLAKISYNGDIAIYLNILERHLLREKYHLVNGYNI